MKQNLTYDSGSSQQIRSQQQPDPAGQPRKIPPGPHGQVHSNSARDAQPDPLQFLLNLTRQYGDVVHYQTVYGPLYFFNHPDHVRDVLHRQNYTRASLVKLALGGGLLSSDGEYWRRQRRLMQPNFHEHCLRPFGRLIVDAATAMLQRWREFADRKQPLDVSVEMKRLTLDVVVQALFSVDLGNKLDMLCEAVTAIMEDLGHISCRLLLNLPLSLTPSRHHQFQTALRTIDQIVYDIINDRRRCQEKPDDLLSMLILARDEESGEGLTDRQLRDEVVTMLIAGHETSALILAWAWYLLAEHPNVERRLHAELAQALAGRLPTVEDLPELPYTRMVFQESMRLYPPVWHMVRQALAADEIAGYDIPKNALVVVSAYTTHRHSDYWENPERFDPERFTPEMSHDRPRYAYFPFAGGRHHCLGNHFAMIEGQLILATVAQCYRLHLVPGHPVELLPVLTLRQRYGLLTTLESRSVATADVRPSA